MARKIKQEHVCQFCVSWHSSSWFVLAEIADIAEINDTVERPNYADLTKALRGNEWCCQTGLNCRPLHYQWSALPLSYGSMLRTRESAQWTPAERADPCHKPPACASAGGVWQVLKNGRNQRGIAVTAFNGPVAGRFGSRFFPKAPRAGAYSIFAWGCFRDSSSRPLKGRHGGRQGPESCRRRGHRSIARADVSRSHRFAMTDDKDEGRSRPAGNERQDRLKLALRENLKRRKSQARGRSDANATPRDDAGASPHDERDEKPGE